MTSNTIQVQISPNLAPVAADQTPSIAAWVLDRQGVKCVVSDPGVVGALLAQAKERGVGVRFYALEGFKPIELDLEEVRRVLGGGKAVVELGRPGED